MDNFRIILCLIMFILSLGTFIWALHRSAKLKLESVKAEAEAESKKEIELAKIQADKEIALAKLKTNEAAHEEEEPDFLGLNPPYVDLGLDVEEGYMETHCEHSVEHMSRHSIAEQNVKCLRCALDSKEIPLVDQGDYSGVHWTWVNNGHSRVKNECVFCEECQNWLLASPDTEHNDHKNNAEDPPEYFHFVRKGLDEVFRDQHGEDTVGVDATGAVYVKDGGDREATFSEPSVATNSIDDKPLPTEPSPPLTLPVK